MAEKTDKNPRGAGRKKTPDNEKKHRVYVGLKLLEDEKNKLEQSAKDNNRSLAAEVSYIVKKYFN